MKGSFPLRKGGHLVLLEDITRKIPHCISLLVSAFLSLILSFLSCLDVSLYNRQLLESPDGKGGSHNAKDWK